MGRMSSDAESFFNHGSSVRPSIELIGKIEKEILDHPASVVSHFRARKEARRWGTESLFLVSSPPALRARGE